MRTEEASRRQLMNRDLIEALVRIGLIVFLVVMCVRIFAPFANLMIWGLVLAIALAPVHQRLARRLGGRQGRASTLLVVIILLLLGVPTVLLGISFADHLHGLYSAFTDQTFAIPPPRPAVAEWPLVGERLYSAWQAAANNLPALLEQNQELLRDMGRRALGAATNTAGSLLELFAALIIGAVMMAYAEPGSRALGRIFSRVTDPERGPQLQRLSTATVRSVAIGVIGVAFIQALLLGVGFLLAGIPAAGVLALIALFTGILQLPALLISLPVIGYLWWLGDGSTTMNIIFTIYLILAGMIDNVLKPLLLGRGVDAPMLIVLLGAIGGMLTGGLVGLFIGGVLLAVSYRLFMEWIETDEHSTTPVPAQEESLKKPDAEF
ncbi:AI-2E family transporter [Halomonas cupida]|uniref:AI-2E family transporter n=1 Tax=Halomonas cupida TaxID=44933 RepID=A0A1M7ETB3_9GAMM|nr:AI-2E family transporter [Halomonas cupida]GEN23255.1 AI-2E family transporter [Halomonas cupida]SHL95085.1 Predicted PurR-regulated permease PerM [Halomonas cupida]